MVGYSEKWVKEITRCADFQMSSLESCRGRLPTWWLSRKLRCERGFCAPAGSSSATDHAPTPALWTNIPQAAKNGVCSVAKTAQRSTPSGSRNSFLGGVRSQKLYAYLRRLFFGFGRVVVALSYDDPRGVFDNFGDDRELVGVGRSQRKTSDYPWPADPPVHPKTVEGLLEEGVFSEGCLSLKTRAAVSTSEQAHRQGRRVADGEAKIVGGRGVRSSCRRPSFIFQRLAACLPKVVRCTHLTERSLFTPARSSVGSVPTGQGTRILWMVHLGEHTSEKTPCPTFGDWAEPRNSRGGDRHALENSNRSASPSASRARNLSSRRFVFWELHRRAADAEDGKAPRGDPFGLGAREARRITRSGPLDEVGHAVERRTLRTQV
jgi:hypothetical protein